MWGERKEVNRNEVSVSEYRAIGHTRKAAVTLIMHYKKKEKKMSAYIVRGMFIHCVTVLSHWPYKGCLQRCYRRHTYMCDGNMLR